MKRRSFLGCTALVGVALAGCTIDPSTGTITLTVDQPSAQAEGAAILAGVEAAAAVAGVASNPLVLAAIAAWQLFTSPPAGSSAASLAADAVQALSPVLPLLKLGTTALAAFNAGVAFVQAFAAAQPTVSVPASTVSTTPAVAAVAGRVAAPIPIPVS